MSDYIPAVHPSWYDYWTDEQMIEGIADANRAIQRLKSRKGYSEDHRTIQCLRSVIREHEHVLTYRGISNVVRMVDPVVVFDLDTMTSWLEAA